MDSSSEFFSTPKAGEMPAALELIYTSSTGPCQLYRGRKDGKFRIYKCLKEEFRGIAMYESALRKEFEIGYNLDSPLICGVYAFSCIEGLGNAIEMEWIDGETLESLQKNLSPSQGKKIALELCDALSYLHSKQVIHRDLKPSNIMLTHNGCDVKLIDFSLADDDAHYVLKEAAGTKVYAAPEVIAGGKADARSDIFSLGMVMAELPGIPQRIIAKCTQRNASARYSEVTEIKKDLEQKRLWVLWIAVFILILIALIATLTPEREQAPVKVESAKDTIVLIEKAPAVQDEQVGSPKASPAQGTGEPKAGTSNPSTASPEDLDAVFRQATDLFEN